MQLVPKNKNIYIFNNPYSTEESIVSAIISLRHRVSIIFKFKCGTSQDVLFLSDFGRQFPIINQSLILGKASYLGLSYLFLVTVNGFLFLSKNKVSLRIGFLGYCQSDHIWKYLFKALLHYL